MDAIIELRSLARSGHGRRRKNVEPTMVIIDAQTVRGGWTIGAKRSILIEYLGLPLAVRVDPAKPPDATSAYTSRPRRKGSSGFVPLAPLYKIERAFARLGRWRRLSRCCEGTEASARAWLEVACLAYVLARLRVEPA